ncbi:MAG: hypothetical protein K2L84_01740 [Muribaculaceae bacterium]|nr:hypothetical protein [Muribaculaceae bacterium]
MNTTKLHIIRLLEWQGIAAVPGLGVFSSRHRAARIEDGIIYPPGRAVSFDTYGCAAGDNALAASISRACSVDTDTAMQIIAGDVEAIRSELQNDGFSVIGNAGRLVSNSGVIEFVAAESFVSNPWLAPVETAAVASDPVSSESEAGEVAARMDNEVFMRSLRRTASSAAAIAIFAFIAFIFSQLPRSNSREPQMASIGFEQLRRPADDVFGFGTGDDEAPLVLVLNTPADGVCDVEPVEEYVSPARYCLVVASLATRAEADKYAGAHGIASQVLEKDGRYRVYSHTSDNYEELVRVSRESSHTSRFPTAWICSR